MYLARHTDKAYAALTPRANVTVSVIARDDLNKEETYMYLYQFAYYMTFPSFGNLAKNKRTLEISGLIFPHSGREKNGVRAKLSSGLLSPLTLWVSHVNVSMSKNRSHQQCFCEARYLLNSNSKPHLNSSL